MPDNTSPTDPSKESQPIATSSEPVAKITESKSHGDKQSQSETSSASEEDTDKSTKNTLQSEAIHEEKSIAEQNDSSEEAVKQVEEKSSTEKEHGKKETKPKAPKKDKKEDELVKKHTSADALELVDEIKEVADGLKEISEEHESTVKESVVRAADSEADPAAESVAGTSETLSKESSATVSPIVKKEKNNFLSFFSTMFKRNNTNTTSNDSSVKGAGKKKRIILIAVLVLLAVPVSLGLLGFILGKPVLDSGKKTAALAQEAYQFIKTQDLISAADKLAETKTSLLDTQIKYQRLGLMKHIPIISGYYNDGEAVITAGLAGIEAGEIALAAVNPYADVLGFKGQGSFTGGTAEDRIVMIVETLDKITPSVAQIGEKLTTVKTELAKIDPQDYPEEYRGMALRSNLVQAKEMIDEIAVAVTDARPMIEVLPQVLGHPESKKYLVIFQNDGELRPTGGFMSAFAILNIDKGRVTPEKSDDIYSLDNKFSKRVQAPEVISKYLNEKVWHLRNMNLSPDYRVSMETFKQYYDELPGEPDIDGIIAIDTTVLQEIVKITGPIEVPGYGTFTVENDARCNLPQIVCELEHIVDKPLATIASNRKSSILGPMMQEIMKKSLGGDKDQLTELLPLLFKLMEEKHILVYFTNEKAQAGAEAFNIAGRMQEFEGDYLHINNANFGGAKSNFYIDELIEQTIEIKDDGT
ncbi:MAG: DUF4012 domain-containing protein, partial [Patescibacteria group bacterium]